MALIIVAIVVVLIGLWFMSTYNKLVTNRMKVKEAFSTMDVYLKKRFDLIPNLVETVKGYVKHENETLTRVVELRNQSASTTQEKVELEKEMSSAVSRLLMVVENYPELKADTQFINLQNQLRGIEEDIEKSRRYYNGAVKGYNTLISLIPTNIVAMICNFKEEPFFEIENKEERENVKVQF